MSGDRVPRSCPSFEAGMNAVAAQSEAHPPPGDLDNMIKVAGLH